MEVTAHVEENFLRSRYGVDGNERGVIDNDAFAKKIWEFGLKYLGINCDVRYD